MPNENELTEEQKAALEGALASEDAAASDTMPPTVELEEDDDPDRPRYWYSTATLRNGETVLPVGSRLDGVFSEEECRSLESRGAAERR